MATRISKKRKFVADGVLYAEVNELLNRELADAGYAGVEIRNAPMKTEIIIRAAEPLKVAGEKARRIRELTSVVQKRFKFAEGAVELFAERVANKGLSAQAQVRGSASPNWLPLFMPPSSPPTQLTPPPPLHPTSPPPLCRPSP